MSEKEDFGWGDKVEVPESQFATLPDGPAFFTVMELKKARRDFSDCGVVNIADITFLVRHEETGKSGEMKIAFPLVRKMGWKIVALATACGFRKHGDSSEIDPSWWGKFKDSVGRCVIGTRKFAKRGESKDKAAKATWTGVASDITEFLPPEEEPAQAQDGKARQW